MNPPRTDGKKTLLQLPLFLPITVGLCLVPWRTADSRTMCLFRATGSEMSGLAHGGAQCVLRDPGGAMGGPSAPHKETWSISFHEWKWTSSSNQRSQKWAPSPGPLLGYPQWPAGPTPVAHVQVRSAPFCSFLSVYLIVPLSALWVVLQVLRRFVVIHYKFTICILSSL